MDHWIKLLFYDKGMLIGMNLSWSTRKYALVYLWQLISLIPYEDNLYSRAYIRKRAESDYKAVDKSTILFIKHVKKTVAPITPLI